MVKMHFTQNNINYHLGRLLYNLASITSNNDIFVGTVTLVAVTAGVQLSFEQLDDLFSW